MSNKWSNEQARKVGLAVTEANKTLENPKFFESILALDTTKYFTGTEDKPEKIAAILKEDKSVFLDVSVWHISWWKRKSSAIAYAANGRIHLRDTYLKNGSPKYIAATLIHEWLHTIGYKHDFFFTKKRPFSVPYAIGTLISSFKEQENAE